MEHNGLIFERNSSRPTACSATSGAHRHDAIPRIHHAGALLAS